jgi:hypothetical protein
VSGLDLLRLHQLLADLAERRLLCHTLRRGGEPAVTVVPFSRSAPEPRGSAPDRVVLSRFACLRREGGSLVAESPLAHSYLIVHAAGVALLSRLATPLEWAGLDEEDAICIDLLWEEGFLSNVDAEDPALVSWEFHDLLFHARSRLGRHRNHYGGTYPFRGVIEPLTADGRGPPLHPRPGGSTLAPGTRRAAAHRPRSRGIPVPVGPRSRGEDERDARGQRSSLSRRRRPL